MRIQSDRYVRLIVCLVILTFSQWAAANNDFTANKLSFADAVKRSESAGVAVTKKTIQGVTTLTLDVNVEKLLRDAAKSINRPATRHLVQREPDIMASGMAMANSSVLIYAVYSDKSIKVIHVKCNVGVADAHGKRHYHQAFSFDFTRALYDRTDWKDFDPRTIGTMTDNFRVTPWFGKRILGEALGF